jgi:iron complex transport system substrate-binding protein
LKKIVSFIPAATQMIYDMGLQHLLVGVTFECPAIALQEKPVVVKCVLEGHNDSSEEIDRIFSASKAQGKSLYYTEDDLLQQLGPDIIITQDVCEVCQIDTKCTLASIEKLHKKPELLICNPATLDDVFSNALSIATALQEEDAGYTYIQTLQKKIANINLTLQEQKAMPKRLSLLEWIKPIYNCGHWIPYQIACAGGIDMLSNPGGDSMVIPWEKIARYNPEVMVIAPCGFHIDKTMQELDKLTTLPGFSDLKAVQDGNVWIMDFDLFTQPSASTLTYGMELIAAAIHPSLFAIPNPLKKKALRLDNQKHLLYA